jgi:antitoxin MazE
MNVRVQKWGNSLALRIPKPFAEDADVREGTVLRLSVKRGHLIAAPVRARKIRLKDLLAGITRENLHDEADWGPRLGKEIW